MKQLWTRFSAAAFRNSNSGLVLERLDALRAQDPFGFAAGDMNVYRFVGNDPTSETDPSGLRPWDAGGIEVFLGPGMKSKDTPVGWDPGTPEIKITNTTVLVSFPVTAWAKPIAVENTNPQQYVQFVYKRTETFNFSVKAGKESDFQKALKDTENILSWMPLDWEATLAIGGAGEALKQDKLPDCMEMKVSHGTWSPDYEIHYTLVGEKKIPKGYVEFNSTDKFGQPTTIKKVFSSEEEFKKVLIEMKHPYVIRVGQE